MMKCTACGKEHTKKEIVFTEDRLPYCKNPFECNDDHPNSVKNIVARGGAVQMFTEEELEENMIDTLDVPDELRERIVKLAGKPQSIRLSKLDIAHYLIMLQETRELASISEAVRYCVTLAMRVDPIKPEDIAKLEPAKESVKLTGEPITIPDIPKSVNVDWSKVEAAPAEPKEDDEFTF